MKFQYKALVAALALSAATVPAQAAVTLASSGSSSLVLSLLDNANNISATFDLGYNYSNFSDLVTAANSGSFTWDLTTGDYADAWSTFSSVANLSTAKWAIYAGDNTGSGVGARGIISTYVSGNKLTATQQLNTSLGNFDSYLNGANALPSHSTTENGGSTAASGNAYAGRSVAYGTAGRINVSGHVSAGNFGDSLTVVQELGGASVAAPTTFSTLGNAQGNYTFSISNAGALSFNVPAITPVPEADSYAMLLAGLGVVGLVARRRKA